MAKKKKPVADPENDVIPDGKLDEEGEEIIDLYAEKDNLEEDLEYDLDNIEDEMLADETEDEEFGMEVDEVVKMLREVKCKPCPGLKSKRDCQIAKDHGCPKPDKP